MLTTWEDGVHDYIAYAEQLRAELNTSGTLLTFGSGDFGQCGWVKFLFYTIMCIWINIILASVP